MSLPPELSDDEIEEILPKLDELNNGSKISKLMFRNSKKGHRWRLKLVEGRSNRKYEMKMKEKSKRTGI
ncbi:MAG: DUF2800 domain-containing protein [Streptococcus salivarius]